MAHETFLTADSELCQVMNRHIIDHSPLVGPDDKSVKSVNIETLHALFALIKDTADMNSDPRSWIYATDNSCYKSQDVYDILVERTLPLKQIETYGRQIGHIGLNVHGYHYWDPPLETDFHYTADYHLIGRGDELFGIKFDKYCVGKNSAAMRFSDTNVPCNNFTEADAHSLMRTINTFSV